MTNPTPDQPRMSVPEAEAALAPLEAAVRAAAPSVRKLHSPASDWSWKPLGCQHDGEHSAPCRGCRGECWPCPTIRALDEDAVVLSEPTDQAAAELASLAVNAGRALQDEKRHYQIACEENARLRAEVERLRADQAAVRAATLREAADWYAQQGKTVLAASQVAADLHRRAGGDAPLSPYYEHPECGFHWHGRDGMDIPIRDGQPVCPRCELAKVQKKLDYTQRMREEVGTECKRRGKRMLEQAEQIRTLEQQLDEVRRQLGEEILRAGPAEDENARLRTGQAAVRAAALREAALHLYTALFPAVYADMGQKAAEGVNRAVSELRRLADEKPTAPGQTSESCVHCGTPIQHVTGTLAAWWVHLPGGNTICDPEHAAASTRATPSPAGPAAPAKEAQPGGEPIVAYRSLGGRILRCLDHVPPEPDTDFVALTAEDLPDGGICTFPAPPCGRDVLTVAERPR